MGAKDEKVFHDVSASVEGCGQHLAVNLFQLFHGAAALEERDA